MITIKLPVRYVPYSKLCGTLIDASSADFAYHVKAEQAAELVALLNAKSSKPADEWATAYEVFRENVKEVVEAVLEELASAKPKTYLHLRGIPEPVELNTECGGCQHVDYDGRLYRVDEAVISPVENVVHVYAYRLSKEIESDQRTYLENYSIEIRDNQ